MDLTTKLGAEGRLAWDVPEGKWTVLRFGRTSTSASSQPRLWLAWGWNPAGFDKNALKK
jgi:hypothetical protein